MEAIFCAAIAKLVMEPQGYGKQTAMGGRRIEQPQSRAYKFTVRISRTKCLVLIPNSFSDFPSTRPPQRARRGNDDVR